VDGDFFGREYVEWGNGSFSRPPGLQKFYFNFEGGGDKHFRRMAVFPQVEGIEMEFADLSADDNYFYSHRAVELPKGTQYKTASFYFPDGSPCISRTEKYETDKFPVLQGFHVEYGLNDHHIDEVGVQVFKTSQGNPVIEVCLKDKNGGDAWDAEVVYALVPSDKIVDSYSDMESEEDGGGEDSKTVFDSVPSDAEPVMTGFDLNFKSKDHHIDRIGAELRKDGTAHVRHQDKNADDDYKWKVLGALVKA